MNYAGKFDATSPSDGQGGASHSYVHVESVHGHAPADAIIVPDAHFLFNADFKRSGLDLVLHKDDHELVLHDYFKGDKHAALASPDGAHLNGDLVTALTGSFDVAQAGNAAAAGQVIGHVTKLAGSATAIRNGVSIILNMGDNVEKGDVVQSGGDSTLGVTWARPSRARPLSTIASSRKAASETQPSRSPSHSASCTRSSSSLRLSAAHLSCKAPVLTGLAVRPNGSAVTAARTCAPSRIGAAASNALAGPKYRRPHVTAAARNMRERLKIPI